MFRGMRAAAVLADVALAARNPDSYEINRGG
jgi:hypothetical protein